MSAVHVLRYEGDDEHGRVWDVIHPPSCAFDHSAGYERRNCAVEDLTDRDGWEAFDGALFSDHLNPLLLQPGLYLVRHWTNGATGDLRETGVRLLAEVEEVPA
jgi:hypothetical protein